ncbi:rCG57123 [Rattus norvegicus]|uniref:UDP-glucuronosyltransferase n=2 Tax=Rattus norvegicus TaxID=10116 RepID=F7FMW8_RAT|nr:UDP-glucuronosyltransferase 2B15 precursor [Rattus norvegicus]AAH78782.1 UDP glucuronosyltransferase 2 family, polypeptide B36 [Rattus norvegicus]EDL89823.1 rCG57123 [Rattus norvegicus]|eukprot:NP_001004271.1 UDP-glucuronosyltransferase 2B15 precursor [Rattus norvegicus]
MPGKWISALLLLQISFCFKSGNCGKVLVWPMEYSHWMNIKIILEELVQKGHEVTVLRPSASVFLDPKETSDLKFVTFPTSFSSHDLENFFTRFVNVWTYELPRDTCLSYFLYLQDTIDEYSDYCLTVCKEAVSNKQFMTKLQESKFDVVFSDAIGPCGELIAELLQIPFLYSLRFSPGYTIEKYIGGVLFPPSYVPMIFSGLAGQMTFIERVHNMICMLYFDFWFQTFREKKWDPFYSKTLGRPTTLAEIMGKAEMWLIRSYWDLEFPHPISPNVDYIGGLHCKPAKPLPKDIEDFVQSSGEHGVVVFSLGSMVRNMTEEKANIIAWALAQIPQKVLWRFDGKKPPTLGPNTRLYKWLPQNDLLGHPKTKAFVTHGGANGIYEAIHHGIPMIGIPLFGEQHDNIAHMVAKGAAVEVNFRTMSKSDMLNALEEVINNPFYKKNAMWLSTIHHDQPTKPLDRAVFWIEFVMRHKGAKHLRSLGHNLPWYQYHSLDVIGFLLTCVAVTVVLALKCFLFVYRFFVKKEKKTKNE